MLLYNHEFLIWDHHTIRLQYTYFHHLIHQNTLLPYTMPPTQFKTRMVRRCRTWNPKIQLFFRYRITWITYSKRRSKLFDTIQLLQRENCHKLDMQMSYLFYQPYVAASEPFGCLRANDLRSIERWDGLLKFGGSSLHRSPNICTVAACNSGSTRDWNKT